MERKNSLFQLVYEASADGNMYAFLSENPVHSMPWFAEGFHQAGQVYVEVLRKNHATVPDTDMLPAVFLYRHAVELALKGLVWNGDEIANLLGRPASGSKGPQGDGHQLPPLVVYAEQVIANLRLRWDAQGVAWNDAKDLITDLDAVDPGSFSFRYPMKRNRSPSQPPGFGFNIFRFASLLDPVIKGMVDLNHNLEDVRYRIHSAQFG